MGGGAVMVTRGGGCAGREPKFDSTEKGEKPQQIPVLDFILSALRKSMVSTCQVDSQDEVEDAISAVRQMEIGWPTNFQHVTHVTFDRFHGFLGLPVEFEVEISCRAPSASISAFGVSPESMQCSYDSRGNSVPTILLLMQETLYSKGGLKSEGIFRINPENGKEEHVRDKLNRGILPQDVDVHCLAGLIKAWFRELPSGVLDGLSPEQVLECNSEEGAFELIKQLKPTESALLSWAVDLMADVVEEEEFNKMNERNIAMVFAPNMTKMSDPLTALMHAVQVMNLLQMLITKALRDREEECTTMSPRSTDEEDYDSQQETGEETCRKSTSEQEEEYSQQEVEEEDEEESCCESASKHEEEEEEETCCEFEFLSEKQDGEIVSRECSASPPCDSLTINADCYLSLSEGRMESSFLITSDGEDENSRASSITSSPCLKIETSKMKHTAIEDEA